MRRLWPCLLAIAAGCRVEIGAPAAANSGEAATVRIYTSVYKHVLDALQPAIEERLRAQGLGAARIEWFQSGSEKVAARIDAELASGGSPCDVLLTADPTYYARLKKEGALAAYVSPAALRQPREYVDPDGAWAMSRMMTMVIVASPALPEARTPRSWAGLASGDLRVALGDPLSSGTNLMAVGALAGKFGWPWFRALKQAGGVVAGGNASVLQRVESGESDAGVVLLENVLAARARGSRVRLVLPTDGALVIPGPIALLQHGRRSEAARAVYDALLSDEVQRVLVREALLHSPDPKLPPPPGAPPLSDLLLARLPLSTQPPEGTKAAFNQVFFQ